jgi:dTDP-4-amino-4,6-dideoxygalactose transaminase
MFAEPGNRFIRIRESMTAPVVPFANPHAAYAARRGDILRAVTRSFDSGHYILGTEVETFEKTFAAYLGLAHVTGCASGTDALEIALRALNVGPGKAVFTVSHTAVATVAAIERTGGVPVLVDISPATYTMDPASLEATVRHLKTQHPELEPWVVIPVHLYGHPCDMDAILAVAGTYRLSVLEDCAQAHGARYKGNMVGSFGDVAAFSFYPTKNLGALGDAGAIATRERSLARKLSALRQYGWEERYVSAIPGVNSRLDPVQAAILSVQLDHLDADNAARRRIAAAYAAGLSSCGLTLPSTAPWADPVFHLYVVLCPERRAFMEFLNGKGIAAGIHYPQPVHLQPAYRDRLPTAPDGLPVTEEIKDFLVSLPMFPQLKEQEIERVIAATREWARAGG